MGTNQTFTPSKSEKSSSIVQAFYGPGVPIPAPYFSAAVSPGHAPHPYMWSSQIASPVNPEVPSIVSTNKERGFEKKSKGLKGLDMLATSIGNSNVKGAGCPENRSSESGDNEAEGSSYGSDVNSESGGSERKRNGSFEAIPNSGEIEDGATKSGRRYDI